jgi:hypothetical protein
VQSEHRLGNRVQNRIFALERSLNLKLGSGVRFPDTVQILRRSFEPWFGAFLLLEIKEMKTGFKEIRYEAKINRHCEKSKYPY